MSSTVEDVDVDVLLDRLDQDVTELLAGSHVTAADEALLARWVRLEALRHRLAAADLSLTAEVDGRGLAAARNLRDTAGLARTALRLTPGEAHARVRAARQLAPRATLTGQTVDPQFPQAAAALSDGELSLRHAQAITEAIGKLPVEIREEVHDTLETHLVGVARQIDPFRLAQHARDIITALDQDGVLRDQARRDRLRELNLHVRPDGSGRLDGELTAEATEVLRTVLDPFTKPQPEADGVKDPRSPGQRRHDGLLAALKAALRAGQIPTAAGLTTTVLLTTTVAEWEAGDGIARTGHGTHTPIREAKRWAGGDYRAMLIRFDDRGGVDGWTDARRLFTESQRLAIIARDKGCTAIGCDAPPSHCEVHHIIEHADGGPTTIANGALLCTWNHTNFEQLGWTCLMLNGRPHWIAPKWLDPSQTPRRNTMHDH